LISTDSFGRFTIPLMQGIEERLSDAGVAVFMCNATDDPAREARHVEQLLCKRVDGIIVTARRADQRPKLKCPSDIPVVYAFSHVGESDACCVLPDDGGAPRWLCAI
jgi:LacI family transcriptional regulator